MNEKEKQAYLKEYKKQKENGVPFYPDILAKDSIITLLIFLVLVALTYFIGAPLEARANPADANYTPRPEWYFLFLFQMLKYFPGNLEVIGVVVIPTIAIILLFLLPFIDRSEHRHFRKRPFVISVTGLAVVGIVGLTIASIRETPPPMETALGDPVAELYTKNCSGCHGSKIIIPDGTNLHQIIAQGKHEGMPAWSADLSVDQIDALAGFILSPAGYDLFKDNCLSCHEAPNLVENDPLTLKAAIENGLDFKPHSDLDIPNWNETLPRAEITALLNFLAAPDGQRLYAINCASCHGSSIPFSGTEEELKAVIENGGMHLEMPSWRETLTTDQIDKLAGYVVDVKTGGDGQTLFNQYCVSCHGQRVPVSVSKEAAVKQITSGGSHLTMPVWGKVLTPEQINALVTYSFGAAMGTPLQVGQTLFAQNCVTCHGDFGEGGPNPAHPGDIIAPISTGEYLTTRDDSTLRSIISQGQPNFGMSPFGSAYGGPLDDEQIDALVSFIRSWAANPPVEVPPEIQIPKFTMSGEELYSNVCAQCHGPDGAGGLGNSLKTDSFQKGNTDQQIFNIINNGHKATGMIAWGEILSSEQISQLVTHIRSFKAGDGVETTTVTFSKTIMPIFQKNCTICHGTFGGWDGSTYDKVINSGDHGPAVIPGDADKSLLAQKILGTQKTGKVMPPGGTMAYDQVQMIIDWIKSGAPDN